MLYAYIRVSSRTQNIDRQLEEIKNFKVINKNILLKCFHSTDADILLSL